ncbi:MAG: hypothetical protein BWY19_00831 [bacterium ADurb.Bin212]|nr:MAG: hypothetical protein BWY19_00831 [bacterium ADurb.Bin212]
MEPVPGGYLSRHLEPEEHESADASNSEDDYGLNHPLFDGVETDYRKEQGFIFEKDGQSIEAQYLPFSRDETDRMLLRLRSARNEVDSPNLVELIEKMIKFYSTGAYNLEKLKIQKDENILDIGGLAESVGASIVFNPDIECEVDSIEPSGRILSSGDIANLSTVVKILHELGHLERSGEESVGARRRYLKRESITESEAEYILRSERDAWAFALTKIKPFLGKDQRGAVLNFIHRHSLSYYSDNIRKQIAPKWRLILPHLLESFSE